jgi:recyclin-1
LQEPFDADDFVERIAWRTTTNISKGTIEDFDPDILHTSFEKTISNLKDLNLNIQKRAEKLEVLCREEEKNHWTRVAELHKSIQVSCVSCFTRGLIF